MYSKEYSNLGLDILHTLRISTNRAFAICQAAIFIIFLKAVQ